MNEACTTCAADLYVGHCETVKYRNAEVATLRAENERLRRFVASLAESPADALDVEMIVAAAATVLTSVAGEMQRKGDGQ